MFCYCFTRTWSWQWLGDRRRRELIRIRQIYIPELIIRLHVLLFTSRHTIPGFVHSIYHAFLNNPDRSCLYRVLLNRNLKLALELPNIVADSRYKLYEDFVNQDGKRLGDYLGAVRQAVLGGLEGGGSEPFRVVLSWIYPKFVSFSRSRYCMYMYTWYVIQCQRFGHTTCSLSSYCN